MKKVGRYEIISELGRGAMGIVYRASDPTIGREVALKVLSLNASPEEGTNSPQEMFMREVRAAGRLAHPSIVTIHDAFEDKESESSCIVMELVSGRTLQKILDSGRLLTLDQTLKLIRQVAEGLDFAHRNQVVHRDLKPANILVTEDGRTKITDFGIAKVLAREGVARTIGVMGTPSYMSPEQVRGGEIDGRTDIFSLGIVFFTMLTGQRPFAGNTAAVMFKIVYEEPAAPSSFNPQLTPAYDYVVKKCLAKDRNLRYSSARELLDDVDDLQHGRQPRSQTVASVPAVPSPSTAVVPPEDLTLAMPIPGLMEAASRHPTPATAPSAPPAAQPRPVVAPPPKPATPQPAPSADAGRPVSPLASQRPSPASSTPAPPRPPLKPAQPANRRGMPPATPAFAQAPDLSAAVPEPVASRPVSPAPQAALSIPAVVQRGQLAAQSGVEPLSIPGPELPAPKSKLIPAVFGGVAVLVLGTAMLGYWELHQKKIVPAPPPQVAVQSEPAPSPPIPNPAASPTPPAATLTEQTAKPASAAPDTAAKPVVRKTTPHAAKAKTAMPPPQAQPVAETAQPTPAAPTSSPEPIATPQPPKPVSVPRIVQVRCNYGFKEATITFSSGGQTLLQETLKGKKKGGFLGIKGAYEGTFVHTITVPAGAPQVSVLVVTRDGAKDLSKAIPMPPAGGFVPTLSVEVDNEHFGLAWKNSSASK
jgi:serine/threonine protein kinase